MLGGVCKLRHESCKLWEKCDFKVYCQRNMKNIFSPNVTKLHNWPRQFLTVNKRLNRIDRFPIPEISLKQFFPINQIKCLTVNFRLWQMPECDSNFSRNCYGNSRKFTFTEYFDKIWDFHHWKLQQKTLLSTNTWEDENSFLLLSKYLWNYFRTNKMLNILIGVN